MSSDKYETKIHWWRGICQTDLQQGVEPVIDVVRQSVTPSALTGPVSKGSKQEGVRYTNASGTVVQTAVTVGNHIKATWLGDNINVLAPLVRKGEQVDVCQFSNMDKFFWKATGRDHHLRDQDRFRLEAAAADGTGQTKTDNNTYSITADGVNGFFLQKTSKKLKEIAAWTWGALAKQGIFIITDDKNQTNNSPGSDTTSTSQSKAPANRLYIDSNTDAVMINNAQKSTVAAIGKDVFVQSPRDLQLTAARQIVLDAPLITINLKQAGIVQINGQAVGINATSYVNTSITVGFSNNVKIAGPLVAGPIRSPLYVHGFVGAAYTAPIINPKTAQGALNLPNADVVVDPSTGRSSTSWAETNSAVDSICTALDALAAKTGVSIDTGSIRAMITKAQMTTVVGDKT